MSTLRIDAWGDSLTEGYTYTSTGRLHFTPYSAMLQEYLEKEQQEEEETSSPTRAGKQKFPRGITCKHHGVSGELTREIKSRFDREHQRLMLLLSPPQQQQQQQQQHSAQADQEGDGAPTQTITNMNINVFLAGTNDLGHGLHNDTIFGNIYEMVLKSIESRRKVIICSIPPTAATPPTVATATSSEAPYEKRMMLNAQLKALAEELGSEHAQFFDLFSACSEERTIQNDDDHDGDDKNKRKIEVFVIRPDLAADNLHFTEDGYRVLASGVADCVRKFLS